MHKQVAADHGFTAIAPFDLLDEDGETEWPVTGGVRLNRAIVGSHAENYTDWVILSHFKGHAMAGFGGAIKNVGIGVSSARGKVLVHSAGTRTSGSIMYFNYFENVFSAVEQGLCRYGILPIENSTAGSLCGCTFTNSSFRQG